MVSGKGVNDSSVRLIDSDGTVLPAQTMREKQGWLKVIPLSPPASGIHILQLVGPDGKKQALRVMLE